MLRVFFKILELAEASKVTVTQFKGLHASKMQNFIRVKISKHLHFLSMET